MILTWLQKNERILKWLMTHMVDLGMYELEEKKQGILHLKIIYEYSLRRDK